MVSHCECVLVWVFFVCVWQLRQAMAIRNVSLKWLSWQNGPATSNSYRWIIKNHICTAFTYNNTRMSTKNGVIGSKMRKIVVPQPNNNPRCTLKLAHSTKTEATKIKSENDSTNRFLELWQVWLLWITAHSVRFFLRWLIFPQPRSRMVLDTSQNWFPSQQRWNQVPNHIHRIGFDDVCWACVRAFTYVKLSPLQKSCSEYFIYFVSLLVISGTIAKALRWNRIQNYYRNYG